MAKTTTEKIESIRIEMQQLKNEEKLLVQKHKEEMRKARTRRLCSRGGYLESRLPEIIALTDEQYYSFLDKTLLTDNARRILKGLAGQNADTTAPVSSEAAAQAITTATTNPTIIGWDVSANEGEDEGNGGRRSG